LSLPESWKKLYAAQVMFRGTSPRVFFSGGFLEVWLPSLLLFAALTVICRVRMRAVWRIATLALLFLATIFFFQPREELAVLVPGVAAIVLIEGVAALRRHRVPLRRLAAICLALVACVAAARQPFFLRNNTYGAFTGPLAIGASVAWLGRRARARHDFAMFLIALTGFHIHDRIQERASYPAAPFEARGMRVVLPAAEARFLSAAVVAIERSTPKDSYVACFPEPGFILFATRRRHPFIDTTFFADLQDAAEVETMIRRLRDAPVAAVLVTNTGELELNRLFAVVSREFRPPTLLGDGSAAGAPGSHATAGKLFLRK